MKHPNPRTVILVVALLGVAAVIAIPAVVHFAAPDPVSYTDDEIAAMQIERIDLNKASAEELAVLPDIGETLSERIVAYREAHGAFTSVEELLNIDGIGDKTYAKIFRYLTVD